MYHKTSSRLLAAYVCKAACIFSLVLLFQGCPKEPIVTPDSTESYRGIILRSTNGGSSWSSARVVVKHPATSTQALGCFDYNLEDNLVIADKSCLTRTTNRGQSWSPLLSLDYEDLHSIYIKGPSTAYVTASGKKIEEGLLFSTTDKGTNWDTTKFEITLWDMDIAVNGNGIIIPAVPTENTYLTTDGGAHWTTANPLPDHEYASQIKFVGDIDHQIAMVCGFNSMILRSTDAGLSWTSIQCPVEYKDLYSIDFLGSVGVIVGANGTILRSTDYGLHWSVITHDTRETLRKVFLDVNAYWIVGDHVILKSTDQGLSFSSARYSGNELYRDIKANESGKVVVIGSTF